MTKEEIKAANPLRDVLRLYGIEPGRGGFVHCPFHSGDRTASLKTYPDSTWHCFGCGAHGDQITFVMLMDGLGFRDACEKLSGGPLDSGTRKSVAMSRMKRDAAERKRTRRERAYRKVVDAIAENRRIQRESEPFSDEWARAVNALPPLIGKAESMEDGSYWRD